MPDVTFQKDTLVWLPDEIHYVVPAKVVTSFVQGKEGKAKKIYPAGEEGEVDVSEKSSSLVESIDEQVFEEGLSDLIQLNQLNDFSVLHKLRLRYEKDEIYTAVSDILVAVNPFRAIDTPEQDAQKLKDIIAEDDLDSIQPHIYKIAKKAYEVMLRKNAPQTVLVAGESGAGKSEATKNILQYLSAVAGASKDPEPGQVSVNQRLLQSNPILEAFGNSKTVNNNNSSRFGKLFTIKFRVSNGHIATAKVDNYLLEAGRVVWQSPEERNYHIYYQMLAKLKNDPTGAEDKEAVKDNLGEVIPIMKPVVDQASGKIPLSYTQGNWKESDVDDWNEMVMGMSQMGIPSSERAPMWRVLAGVLALGNMDFKEASGGKIETFFPKGDFTLDQCEQLLGVRKSGDLADSLCSHLVAFGKNDVQDVPYSVDQGRQARDSICRRLHAHIFDYLVHRINEALREDAQNTQLIGVLDIFGFEVFKTNSFEQLCINYCNEKLQGFFNTFIFSMEQLEYDRECVPFPEIDVSSNDSILFLLESKVSEGGMFRMLDDENKLLRKKQPATDESFLSKATKAYAKNFKGKRGEQILIVPPFSKKAAGKNISWQAASALSFRIAHYAAVVQYDASSFLQKNADSVPKEVTDVLLDSKDSFVHLIMNESAEGEFAQSVHHKSSSARWKFAKDAVKTGFWQAPKSSTVPHNSSATLGSIFRQQLKSLMATLQMCDPHFVRCIKPNWEKQPHIFTAHKVLEQLQCTGLLGVCQVRKKGYPVRIPFDEFMENYGGLAKGACADVDALLPDLLSQSILEDGGFAKGKTKVFLRQSCIVLLSAAKGIKVKKMLAEAAVKKDLDQLKLLLKEAIELCCTGPEVDAAMDIVKKEEDRIKAEAAAAAAKAAIIAFTATVAVEATVGVVENAIEKALEESKKKAEAEAEVKAEPPTNADVAAPPAESSTNPVSAATETPPQDTSTDGLSKEDAWMAKHRARYQKVKATHQTRRMSRKTSLSNATLIGALAGQVARNGST